MHLFRRSAGGSNPSYIFLKQAYVRTNSQVFCSSVVEDENRHIASGLFAAKAIGGDLLQCVLLLHLHEQALPLRSHAGGFSVVSSAECMLYAASEVSVIHRQGVWPSLHPHQPYHSHPPPQTSPAIFLSVFSVISNLMGTLSDVCPLLLACFLKPQCHKMQIILENHSSTSHCFVHSHFHKRQT